jgi:hypothetical protein
MLVDGQNVTLMLLKARQSLRRRDGGELERGWSWRRRLDSVDSRLPDKRGSWRGATGLMYVTEILRVAAVELQVVSSIKLLHVAWLSASSISSASLKRETEVAEGAEGADLEEERGGRGGPQRAPSSPPSMANGRKDGGEDDPKTDFWKSKIKGGFEMF